MTVEIINITLEAIVNMKEQTLTEDHTMKWGGKTAVNGRVIGIKATENRERVDMKTTEG